MNILICEDELIIAEYIKDCCLDLGFNVVGIAKNREQALAILSRQQIDMALLDINMDEPFSGVKIAEHIKAQQPLAAYLFITAFSDLKTVEAAIRTQPQGYLVKPLDKDTLVANLLLAKHKLSSLPKTKAFMVSLETEMGQKSFDISQLAYISSDGNYCDFFDINSRKTVERISLLAIEQGLSEHFIRIHKSYVVNPQYVERFSSLKVILNNGTELPVGRKYKEQIATFLNSAH